MSDPRKKKIEAALESLFSSPPKHSLAGRKKAAPEPVEKGAIPPASQDEPVSSGEASTSEAQPLPGEISTPTNIEADTDHAETTTESPANLPLQVEAAEGNREAAYPKDPISVASAEPALKIEDTSSSSIKDASPTASAETREETASSQKSFDACQLVIFKVGQEYFGVSIQSVDSIIQKQSITRLPRAKPYISGLTNLRGVVLPVINLRKRLGLRRLEEGPEAEAQDNGSIMVTLVNGEKIGVQVDAVTEVITIPGDMIAPPPTIVATTRSDFLWGIAALGDRSIMLLDLAKTLEL